MARPVTTSYSDDERREIITHVLAEVAGGRSLHTVLLHDDGMPAATTFWRWHMEDEELRDNLARAREAGTDAMLEEARHIADTLHMGITVKSKPVVVDGQPIEGAEIEEVTREDMLGHRKLQVETRFKAAQMIAPRKYGPKLDLTTGGEKLSIAATMAARRARVAEDSGDQSAA